MPQNITPPPVISLKNGLRVLLHNQPHTQTLAMGIWVGAGSRNEPLAGGGIAHFLEHMAFKGTKKRTAFDIAQAVENIGGYMNAYTGRETTAYYLKVLKDDYEIALDVLSDVIQNSVLAPCEIDRERNVILQEIAMVNDTPEDKIGDLFYETAFPNQPLGVPILGSNKSVEEMTQETLKGFIAPHYTTNNMVISLVGNLPPQEKLLEMLEQSFSTLATHTSPLKRGATYQGGHKTLVRPCEQAHILYGFEAPSKRDPDYYASLLLSAILGGGMASRLFQEIREKAGLVYTIDSSVQSFTDTGVFSIYAGVLPKNIPLLSKILTEELQKICVNVSDTELERVKTQVKAGQIMGFESNTALAESFATQTLLFGAPLFPQDVLERFTKLTANEIIACAKRIFATPQTISLISPQDYDDLSLSL